MSYNNGFYLTWLLTHHTCATCSELPSYIRFDNENILFKLAFIPGGPSVARGNSNTKSIGLKYCM